jgi:hypothetical protein
MRAGARSPRETAIEPESSFVKWHRSRALEIAGLPSFCSRRLLIERSGVADLHGVAGRPTPYALASTNARNVAGGAVNVGGDDVLTGGELKLKTAAIRGAAFLRGNGPPRRSRGSPSCRDAAGLGTLGLGATGHL